MKLDTKVTSHECGSKKAHDTCAWANCGCACHKPLILDNIWGTRVNYATQAANIMDDLLNSFEHIYQQTGYR